MIFGRVLPLRGVEPRPRKLQLRALPMSYKGLVYGDTETRTQAAVMQTQNTTKLYYIPLYTHIILTRERDC